MARQNISSGNPLESTLGYSRAVRVGSHIFVTGTASFDDQGKTVGVGDVEAQTRRCMEIIGRALAEAGASFDDVVRTRIMLANIDDWEIAGRVHGEVFGSIRPATIVYAVSRFINPEWLIEIEADAVMETGVRIGRPTPGAHLPDQT